MVEINRMEADYIRPRFPNTSIYRTTHSKYIMSEEGNAMRALAKFRELSIFQQKKVPKGEDVDGFQII